MGRKETTKKPNEKAWKESCTHTRKAKGESIQEYERKERKLWEGKKQRSSDARKQANQESVCCWKLSSY